MTTQADHRSVSSVVSHALSMSRAAVRRCSETRNVRYCAPLAGEAGTVFSADVGGRTSRCADLRASSARLAARSVSAFSRASCFCKLHQKHCQHPSYNMIPRCLSVCMLLQQCKAFAAAMSDSTAQAVMLASLLLIRVTYQ